MDEIWQQKLRDAANASRSVLLCLLNRLSCSHTIRLIRELDSEIEDIEAAIQAIMDELQSPITTIPGMGVSYGSYDPCRNR